MIVYAGVLTIAFPFLPPVGGEESAYWLEGKMTDVIAGSGTLSSPPTGGRKGTRADKLAQLRSEAFPQWKGWGEELHGQQLVAVAGSTCPKGRYLRVQTDRGVHTWLAIGDCCADAWAVNVIATLPSAIVHAQEKPFATLQQTSCEQIDVGFYEITTVSGVIQIELRVRHNGYYGGWLEYQGFIHGVAL